MQIKKGNDTIFRTRTCKLYKYDHSEEKEESVSVEGKHNQLRN